MNFDEAREIWQTMILKFFIHYKIILPFKFFFMCTVDIFYIHIILIYFKDKQMMNGGIEIIKNIN